jgi:hypothetical protein
VVEAQAGPPVEPDVKQDIEHAHSSRASISGRSMQEAMGRFVGSFRTVSLE